MPLLSSHRSSYISVFLCLPVTADNPLHPPLLAFMPPQKTERGDRFILGHFSPALHAGMAAASFDISWNDQSVGTGNVSPSLGGRLSLLHVA